MLAVGILLLTLTPAALGASLAEVATSNGCGKIVGLIKAAGLADALAQAHDVTLFAPDDAAVDRIPPAVLKELQQNVTLLQQVLKFHVVTRVARAADIVNDLLLPTLEPSGAQLRLNVYKNAQEKTVITAEGAPVTKTDLAADNGIVHVIDKVIYPLPLLNIPLLVTFTPELSKLAYMVYTAKLPETLAGGNYTVFAPSDEALNKIPGQEFQKIITNLTLLREVLFTHVVKGVVFSAGLSNGETLTNLQGTELRISIGTDGVKVNKDSTVTQADVPASNGVIHVIDTVIMPQK